MAEKEFKRIETTDPAHADVLNEKIVEPAMELAQKVNNVDQKVAAHLAEKATLTELGHVNYGVLTATLGTNWSGSEAPYTQTISVSEILATDSPIIDVVMSGIYSTDESRIEAWGYIYRAVTADGSITFYATEIPTVEIPLQIKVVR